MRLRICLDQSILNSATDIISFPLITGEELSQSLFNFDTAISIDNKKSYYLAFLGPLCAPYFAFRWLNLIMCFNVPVFGLVNSPAFNEIFQQISIFELKEICYNMIRKTLLKDISPGSTIKSYSQKKELSQNIIDPLLIFILVSN
jgi:hypothetical protein